jgi:methionyl-tRNA formyltransferase
VPNPRPRKFGTARPCHTLRTLRILFLGTPDFALPTLDALARVHEIVCVVAQPDKPSGRGMHVHSPAVAVHAKELGLPLMQPARIRELSRSHTFNADLGVVVAYGKILPAALLAMPKHGFVNVHASLLPKYRGAAPIQRAIEHGETTTGVTIMRLDEELDHGSMLDVASIDIAPDEHTPSLAKRLSQLGAQTLLRAIDDLREGTPQDHSQATLAPKIEKHEGLVNWNEPARAIYNKYRAFDPWPGLFTADGIKLFDVTPGDEQGAPGTVLRIDDEVVFATGEGSLHVKTMQRPGKARAAAADVARFHIAPASPPASAAEGGGAT